MSGPVLLVILLFAFFLPLRAQKIAVIVPEKNESAQKFAGKLEAALSLKFKILDSSMSETAFRSVAVENIFNLTTEEAKTVGARVGCDYFLLLKPQEQRRTSLSRSEYYEAFTFVYAVSTRTGRLVFWKIQKFEAFKQNDATRLLLASTTELGTEITEKLKAVSSAELNERASSKFEEVPPENSVESKNFRPPLPFKRIKPPYTKLADFYRIAATVDILVDINENGVVVRTEIARWAGFGLDEVVDETVRQMKWRAAERNGKFIPMRVLLRYNFKKIDKEES